MSKAILWDFDGTLSYPNQAFFSALHTAIREYGYQLCPELSAAFLQSAYSWKNPEFSYVLQDWWQVMHKKVSEFCLNNHVQACHIGGVCERFRQLLIDISNYQLYPDTISVLKQCWELGFENYIATNNYPEITENIHKLGLKPYINGCIVSAHIGFEKPRIEFYRAALDLAPHALYMVGDNPIADIQGAQAMGLHTIAVHSCTNSTAEYYCQTLSDILPILKT